MTHIILEQQVSLASAAAAFRRLRDRLDDEVAPGPFLRLTDAELREIGFSRQKAGYVRELASGIAAGDVDLPALETMPDADALRTLLDLRGIGPWSAGIYLMFTLDRPDVWPPGDRALHVAMATALSLGGPPSSEEATEIARRWRPWRSAAARLLWHDYLGGPDVVPA
jgi:DNA-3-methyladenine glycosylase II